MQVMATITTLRMAKGRAKSFRSKGLVQIQFAMMIKAVVGVMFGASVTQVFWSS
jgi:hypothetical protein